MIDFSTRNPSHKQALRLSRRMHRRGIHTVNFCLLSTDVTMEVGRRVVQIMPTGEIRQQMRPSRTTLGWRADPQGLSAFRNRIQAIYMERAAVARSEQKARQGRIMVDAARFDRLYGG